MSTPGILKCSLLLYPTFSISAFVTPQAWTVLADNWCQALDDISTELLSCRSFWKSCPYWLMQGIDERDTSWALESPHGGPLQYYSVPKSARQVSSWSAVCCTIYYPMFAFLLSDRTLWLWLSLVVDLDLAPPGAEEWFWYLKLCQWGSCFRQKDISYILYHSFIWAQIWSRHNDSTRPECWEGHHEPHDIFLDTIALASKTLSSFFQEYSVRRIRSLMVANLFSYCWVYSPAESFSSFLMN